MKRHLVPLIFLDLLYGSCGVPDVKLETTHSGYGTTPVWCRGGSRYVEGYWGFPYLKIEKFVGFAKNPFHVFDRYEILIQDFWDLFTGIVIIFQCPSSQKQIEPNISATCLLTGSVKQIWKFWIFKMLRCEKICFKDVSIFSCISWGILVINKGCKGPDLVNLLQVPKMIQKVLVYVREP